MKFKHVKRLPEFEKDLKKLKKRYRTIEDDLKNFEDGALVAFHKLDAAIHEIKRIPGPGTETPELYKSKKFACRSMKGTGGKSGIRVVYAYSKEKDEITYIEIYYKGDKESEDKKRIRGFIRSIR